MCLAEKQLSDFRVDLKILNILFRLFSCHPLMVGMLDVLLNELRDERVYDVESELAR